MSHAWLSAILPTYNGVGYLRATLQSIQQQNDPNIEIIAVDDGSSDGTLAILREFSAALPIVVIERPHLGNWVANTNHGFSVARGDFITLLHQDDLWLPGRLAAIKEALSRAPQPQFILHASLFIDDSGRKIGTWNCPLPAHGESLTSEALVTKLLVQNFIALPAPVFHRSLVATVGPMDESLWYAADWDFWLRMAAITRALYLPLPLAAFRVHAQSQTVIGSARASDIRRQLELVLKRHWGPWASSYGGSQTRLNAAKFAIELNLFMMAKVHRQPRSALALVKQGLKLGPLGWWIFGRDSTIVARVWARLKVFAFAR